MAEIFYSEADAQMLQDKVVVLTGGAQGIGAATVALYHSLGAHVYFGDWDEAKGLQLQQTLSAKGSSAGATTTTTDGSVGDTLGPGPGSGPGPGPGTVHFQRLNVCDYASQLSLFDTPFNAHGRVDVAVSCAAVSETGSWFEPEALDLESVKEVSSGNPAAAKPLLPPLPLPTPRRHSPAPLCLVSSIAGITEAPGLFSYSASKHGIIGLMRALRPFTPSRFGSVRVNAVCPWATDTQLLGGVKTAWEREGMPLNTPLDVAKVVVQDESLTGTAIFVTGGRYFDTEEGLARTMPLWMGQHNAREFIKGQQILGLGGNWAGES
ncbi:hypothetical protein BD289DRAFT_458642 [Coniella lustricola]|uniref:Uncharacterized protein n=1 Tax=Coniella lustricola TaxID=2025994 RepID=A0A2T3AIQ7_9PEZI|nr:hypothetical protein BD289DRAFT_458642 [Coniella lustricola]